MKPKTKKIVLGTTILAIAILALFGLQLAGIIKLPFTIIYGIPDIKCSWSGTDMIVCSESGVGNVGDEFTPMSSDEIISLRIDNVDRLWNSQNYLDILKAQDTNFASFFSEHPITGTSGTGESVYVSSEEVVNKAERDYWSPIIGVPIRVRDTYLYELSRGEIMSTGRWDNQLMIMELTIQNMYNSSKKINVKTYGFCNITDYNGFCKIHGAYISPQDFPRSIGTINSMTIMNVKLGGYTEDDVCSVAQLNCPISTTTPSGTTTPGSTPSTGTGATTPSTPSTGTPSSGTTIEAPSKTLVSVIFSSVILIILGIILLFWYLMRKR